MNIDRNRLVKSYYDVVYDGSKAGYALIIDQLQGARCQSWSILRYVGETNVVDRHLAALMQRKGRSWSLKRYEWCSAEHDYAWCEVFDGRIVVERRGIRTTQMIAQDAVIQPLVRMIAQYPRWGKIRDQVTFTLLDTGTDRVVGPASLVRTSAIESKHTYNLLAGDELIETLVVDRDRLISQTSHVGVSLILTSQEGALSRLPLPIQALEIRDREERE